jgi:hypothetical protein
MFFHIPKCGGSSVVESAVSVLGAGYVHHIGDIDARTIERRIPRLLAARPSFSLLSAHIPPERVSPALPLDRVIVLRDPLERLQSHFCFGYAYRYWSGKMAEFFLRSSNANPNRFDKAVLLNWTAEFSMDNLETRMLSGNLFDPITNNDIERAIAALGTMDLVGTTHKFESFLRRLGMRVADTPFPMRHENDSNRDLLVLGRDDEREVIEKFLFADQIVFEAAKRMAASEAKWVGASSASSARQRKPMSAMEIHIRWLRHTGASQILRYTIRSVLRRLRKWREKIVRVV